MSLKPIRRNYNCSDANLKAAADQIANCATRDIADFAAYNVDVDAVAAFQATVTAFADKTTDDESLGDQKTETDNKNALRKDIEDTLRLIRTAAQLKYAGQGKYRKFGFDGFTELSDNGLVRMVRRVIRVLTELKTEMTPSFPSINDKLTSLTTKGNAFDDAVDQIIDKKNARDIATQDRIIAGNAVYAGLYKFCTIGKALYQDTNEAKYNDYVLGFQGSIPTNPVDARVSGSIINSTTGAPVAGVTITLEGDTVATQGLTYNTVSQSNGTYSLDIPSEGPYVLWMKKTSFRPLQTTVQLTKGEITNFDASLPPYTSIVGLITDSVTNAPLIDVEVTELDSENNLVHSGLDGRYEIEVADQDAGHTLYFSKAGYAGFHNTTPIQVNKWGQTTYNVQLVVAIPEPQGISGHVANSSNLVPISGVLVKDLIIPDLSATTDDNGYFFYNVPNSYLDSTHHVSLQLQFSKPGFVTYQMPAAESIGQSNRLLLDNLQLTPIH